MRKFSLKAFHDSRWLPFKKCLLPALFFIGTLLYIRWRLNPELIYQCQTPPFLWETSFFRNFLTFPGGISEYISSTVSQFYYYSWPGALIITACLVLAYLLSRSMTGQFLPGLKNSVFIFIPSILLLILFSQYEHRLTFTIAWLQSAGFFLFYLRLQSKPGFLRFLFFLFMAVITYLISAGFLLLFAVLAILSEVILRHRPISGLIYLLSVIAIPYAAQSLVFILTLKSAYFYLLLPTYHYHPSAAPFFLILYLPLVLILAGIRFPEKMKSGFRRFEKKFRIVLLCFLACSAALVSFDSGMHTILRVDNLAWKNQWMELIHYVRKHPSDDILVAFQTNRALCNTGLLSSEMFAYHQGWGISGLYLPGEARKFFSIQTSGFYWDIGFLNEAEHWVLEDHSSFVPGPFHLQRLALISILQGNNSLASMVLDALSKTILYRSWAEDKRRLIGHPKLIEKDVQLNVRNTIRVQNDFIANPVYPEKDLEAIVAGNPYNRAAVDYLLADYMLTFQLDKFIAALGSMARIKSPSLPEHYQEAVIVYLQNTMRNDRESTGKGIEAEKIAQFHDFMEILQNHQGDILKAQAELKKKYGHTYWYYSLFNHPDSKTPSGL